jgi:hypothetical protein
MPIFFLFGALYPLNNLPNALSAVTSVDPLAYGVDGLRATLIGLSHFGVATDGLVLVVIASLVLVIGSYLFSKIQVCQWPEREAQAHIRRAWTPDAYQISFNANCSSRLLAAVLLIVLNEPISLMPTGPTGNLPVGS